MAAITLVDGTRRESLLARLGVVGLDGLEPVVVAALITAEPLLLIGPHGTGKSYLLERLAVALGLQWRHYNAALVNYDDLVGYPLPDGKGGLEFVRTPATVWDAEAVFLDEISRCRPDLQNKLFPIIHERRVQGIGLEHLVYRWSAMNPPVRDEDDPEMSYKGSEALDPALADRFAFVVAMPAWARMSPAQQEAIIRARGGLVCPVAASALRARVQAGKSLLPGLHERLEGPLARYVRAVAALLRQANAELSPRRCGMLLRNIVAVHAARLAELPDAAPGDSALLALQNALPQAATEARPPDGVKVLAAHREAWKLMDLPVEDPRCIVLLEADPLARALWAARSEALAPADFSAVVADALASLPPGGRHALAFELFQTGAAGRLVAAVAEQCAQLYALVASPQELAEHASVGQGRHRTWQHLLAVLAKLDAADPDTVPATNLLVGLFAARQLAAEKDVGSALASWQEARTRAGGHRP